MGKLADRRQRLRKARRRARRARRATPKRFGGLRRTLGSAIQRMTELIQQLDRRIARRANRPDWPERAHFRELLYHDAHVHIAMCDRTKLIRICKIAEEHYGLRVGEFPPFDPVEDVHVSGSYHYRQSGRCDERRTFANRGDGLAADLNGVREVEFYEELRRRYA